MIHHLISTDGDQSSRSPTLCKLSQIRSQKGIRPERKRAAVTNSNTLVSDAGDMVTTGAEAQAAIPLHLCALR
jgi:hypothetical protein